MLAGVGLEGVVRRRCSKEEVEADLLKTHDNVNSPLSLVPALAIYARNFNC